MMKSIITNSFLKGLHVMLRAIDNQGNFVNASNANPKGIYYCPTCHQPLQLKALSSKCMRIHFAHKPKMPCNDSWQYDMSEWHYSWQEKFPEECREVVLEKNGIKHRADILINNTVIEFQHSPISSEEFQERNRFYLDCGKKLVWIFDMSKKVKTIEGNTLRLTRKRDFLDNYTVQPNFNIYIQDNDRLFPLIHSDDNIYYFLYPELSFTPDIFLMDFSMDKGILKCAFDEFFEERQRRFDEYLNLQKIKSERNVLQLQEYRRRVQNRHPRFRL